jgi:hypothetical protein
MQIIATVIALGLVGLAITFFSKRDDDDSAA